MIVVSRPILTISEEQTQAKVNKIANFIVIKETKICHKKCLLSFYVEVTFTEDWTYQKDTMTIASNSRHSTISATPRLSQTGDSGLGSGLGSLVGGEDTTSSCKSLRLILLTGPVGVVFSSSLEIHEPWSGGLCIIVVWRK